MEQSFVKTTLVIDLEHNSWIGQIEKAMAALGKRLVVTVRTEPLPPRGQKQDLTQIVQQVG